MSEIEAFTIAATDEQLADLKQRLNNTRWPEAELVEDWTQGIPLAYVQDVCAYWANDYDWRAREALLNRFDHFKTEVDGLGIHFIHQQSPHPEARPLLITHGWPGSIVEFHKVIEPLVDPVAHGGDAADAFHVVAPSLPGFGFSDKPTETGWGVEKIAVAWGHLMAKLGYDTYLAQHYGAYYDKLPDLLRRTLIPSLTGLLPPTAQKKGLVNKIKRFAEGGSLPARLGHARWRLFATADELKNQMVGEAAAAEDIYGHIERLRDQCDELDPVNQALYIDTHSYLTDNCLPKVDRMSMAVSLETRVPFLDPALMKSVFRMPGEHKLAGGETKPLLKELAAMHVPHDCVYRNKEGFSIPIKQWLVEDFSSLLTKYLARDRLEQQGIFNADYTHQLINEHRANTANHSHRLWSLIVFQAWSDKWLDGPTI